MNVNKKRRLACKALVVYGTLFGVIAQCPANEEHHHVPSLNSVQPAKTAQNDAAKPIPFEPTIKSVKRDECFPVEKLSKVNRVWAEELLLKICDSEALYTLVGNIKPMSTDWLVEDFDSANPDALHLDQVREILNVIRSGDEISAHLLRFSHVHDGKVRFKAALFNHRALAREINQHSGFWQANAITPHAHPLEILSNIESEQTDRFERVRAYGYLAGYPESAVHNYIDIIKRKFADPKRAPIPVDYVRIPTYSKNVYGFVYSVPKGYQLTDEDKTLIARCQPILKEYTKRRAKYIGKDKKGIVALLRDWFHDGKGHYSPQFAKY